MNFKINYKNVFLALIAAILLAIPTAAAFQNKDAQIEKSEQQKTFEIERRDSQLEKIKIEKKKTDSELEKERKESEKLKRENEQLQKDLQAKKAREAEEARVAAAEREKQEQQQAQQAAVSVAAPKPTAVASGDCYASELSKYDWDVGTMQRIMRAESGCNPTNHNHADNHRVCLGSYGLLQIGCVHGYSIAHLSNPANNIAAAYKIYQSQGYTAWTTY